MKDFELIPHTADLQIKVYGKTKKELFKNALIGMFQSIHPKNSECKYENTRIICSQLAIEHTIELDAPDQELLLVDFLSEALYLSDVNNEAYLDAEISELTETRIKAKIKGIKITGFEVVEIKAVTFHGLKIENIDGIWQTDVVFDI